MSLYSSTGTTKKIDPRKQDRYYSKNGLVPLFFFSGTGININVIINL